MKKKGFTLVELLVVIAIIGLLVAIAVPSGIAISKKIKMKMLDTKIEIIEQGAVAWGQSNKSKIPAGKDNCSIEEIIDDEKVSHCLSKSLTELLNENALEEDELRDLDNDGEKDDKVLINPVTNEPLNECNVEIYIKNKRVYAKYDINGTNCGYDNIEPEKPANTGYAINFDPGLHDYHCVLDYSETIYNKLIEGKLSNAAREALENYNPKDECKKTADEYISLLIVRNIETGEILQSSEYEIIEITFEEILENGKFKGLEYTVTVRLVDGTTIDGTVTYKVGDSDAPVLISTYFDNMSEWLIPETGKSIDLEYVDGAAGDYFEQFIGGDTPSYTFDNYDGLKYFAMNNVLKLNIPSYGTYDFPNNEFTIKDTNGNPRDYSLDITVDYFSLYEYTIEFDACLYNYDCLLLEDTETIYKNLIKDKSGDAALQALQNYNYTEYYDPTDSIEYYMNLIQVKENFSGIERILEKTEYTYTWDKEPVKNTQDKTIGYKINVQVIYGGTKIEDSVTYYFKDDYAPVLISRYNDWSDPNKWLIESNQVMNLTTGFDAIDDDYYSFISETYTFDNYDGLNQINNMEEKINSIWNYPELGNVGYRYYHNSNEINIKDTNLNERQYSFDLTIKEELLIKLTSNPINVIYSNYSGFSDEFFQPIIYNLMCNDVENSYSDVECVKVADEIEIYENKNTYNQPSCTWSKTSGTNCNGYTIGLEAGQTNHLAYTIRIKKYGNYSEDVYYITDFVNDNYITDSGGNAGESNNECDADWFYGDCRPAHVICDIYGNCETYLPS